MATASESRTLPAALLSIVTVALVVSGIVVLGVLTSPFLVTVIAPGFAGEKRELTIRLVRILFPGAGLLVLSAWCLGVLNSHGRFLLSYAAPVMWNAAMIATLVAFGADTPLPRLAVLLAWGSVAGSALQFAVQLPAIVRVAPGARPAFDLVSNHVREVVRNFAPAFLSRGVVQVSAYIDSLLASLLPTGAVTGLANAQVLYTLPVSLFGMSIAAAELPAMAGERAADRFGADAVRTRLNAGLRQIAFFVVPSALAFLALGDVIAAALLQTGRFRHEDALYVWGILAGSAVGLLASTLGRLYSSTYYALRDTRTPLAYAMVRLGLTTALGYVFAIPLPRWLGVPGLWGAAGLTASAGIAGWAEMWLLRRKLNRRIGRTGLPSSYLARLWIAAGSAAGTAWALKVVIPPLHPALTALVVLTPYGAVFLACTFAMGLPEASNAVKPILRRR